MKTALITGVTGQAGLGLDGQADGPSGDSPQTEVRLWGSGRARREFLHVDDLAEACLRIMMLTDDDFVDICAANPPNSGDGPVSFINIGTGEDLTIGQLADMVSQVVGFDGPVIWDESKPDGTPQKLLDVSRLKRTGWKPAIDLENGIKSVYEWYLRYPGGKAPA